MAIPLQEHVRALRAALGPHFAEDVPALPPPQPAAAQPRPLLANGSAAPVELAGLAEMLGHQLAELEQEAALAAESSVAATTHPSPRPRLPSIAGMRSTLQALAAGVAAATPLVAQHNDSASLAAAQTGRRHLQDAASTAGGCDAGCQTAANAKARPDVHIDGRPSQAIDGGDASALQLWQPGAAAEVAKAAARRADKWKARCGELRRALADSRSAAAVAASLKVRFGMIAMLECTAGPSNCKPLRFSEVDSSIDLCSSAESEGFG